MGSRDPRVDAYIEKAAPFARPSLKHLRKVVHEGCPGVDETIKWSFPHFTYNGMLCAMAAFKQHCTFGFWKGALLKEEGLGTPSRDAMGQFGRITALADLPPGRTLVRLVKKAAALNEKGISAPRTATTRSARATNASTSSGSPRRSETRPGGGASRPQSGGSPKASRRTGST